MKYTISEAKNALKLPELMRLIGVPKRSIPEHDRQNVPCPWHPDRNPSFGIYLNKTRAHCFTCEFNLDGPQFISKWKNVSAKEGCIQFLKYAKGHRIPVQPKPSLTQQSSGVPCAPEPEGLKMPQTWMLSEAQISQVSNTRQILFDAVHRAVDLGVLFGADVCREPSWLLKDNAGRIAEARRLSGKPYPAWEHLVLRKAHTVRGSCKSWPMGAALLESYPNVRAIMLVEGGPDYLAALHFAVLMNEPNVLPIAMLGRQAGQGGIDSHALKLLRGRRVRIYPHLDADGGGLRSAKSWASQLRNCGCNVDFYDFQHLRRSDGTQVKDLNDMTTLHPYLPNKIKSLLP